MLVGSQCACGSNHKHPSLCACQWGRRQCGHNRASAPINLQVNYPVMRQREPQLVPREPHLQILQHMHFNVKPIKFTFPPFT